MSYRTQASTSASLRDLREGASHVPGARPGRPLAEKRQAVRPLPSRNGCIAAT